MSTINIKSKKVTELTEATELKDSDLFPMHDGTGLKSIKFSNIRDKILSNSMYLYDQTTGDKYVLGVDNGLLYFEEVEG